MGPSSLPRRGCCSPRRTTSPRRATSPRRMKATPRQRKAIPRQAYDCSRPVFMACLGLVSWPGL